MLWNVGLLFGSICQHACSKEARAGGYSDQKRTHKKQIC